MLPLEAAGALAPGHLWGRRMRSRDMHRQWLQVSLKALPRKVSKNHAAAVGTEKLR